MQIVVTALLDDVWALLGQTSELADRYSAGAPDFDTRLTSWLASADAVLQKHRRPQVAELAGLRAQLKAAGEGVFDIRHVRVPDVSRTRKIRRAVAALLFNNAQALLGGIFEAFSGKRDEAVKYLRQMVMVSLQKNFFFSTRDPGGDRVSALVKLWERLLADGDTQNAARHVLSLVSYPDVLRLLDEIISEWKL